MAWINICILFVINVVWAFCIEFKDLMVDNDTI